MGNDGQAVDVISQGINQIPDDSPEVTQARSVRTVEMSDRKFH
jgi:hypothetical protein